MTELRLKGGILWLTRYAIRLLRLRQFITVWPCDHSLNTTIIRHYRLKHASIWRVCLCGHVISCDKGLRKHSSPQGFYGEKGAGLDLYVDT